MDGGIKFMGTFECRSCGKQVSSIGHYGQCKVHKERLDKILSEEVLIELYRNKGMSAYAIAKELDISNAGTIISRLKKFGVQTRNVKESTQMPDSKSRRAKTNLKKFGAENVFCRESTNRQKWEKRLFEEEGITNVFQRKSVKIKSTKTMLKKYGVETPMELSRGIRPFSNLNKQIYNILLDHNIIPHVELKLPNPEAQYYSYDFLIPDTKKIIEVNGDYWHGNPILYKADDLILKNTSCEMKVSDKWEKDVHKLHTAKKAGYSVLVIWEYDLNNSYKETVKGIINYATS